MRTKFIALAMAALFLLGIASAQEYSIRANRGLNLRTEPSRDAAIADTVRAGSILQVVGNFNRWLKIERNGRQVWLADWVDFSRVDSPASPPSPTPAATPSQPAASEFAIGAIGGNCCNTIWDCWFEEERVQGYFAYQINQCAGLPRISAVALTGPVPRIEGSSRFVNHIIASLKWLKSIEPDWYNYVISVIDLIVEEEDILYSHYNSSCVARAYPPERRVGVEPCWIDISSEITGVIEFDQATTAFMLGHEACHIHVHDEGKWFATQDDEEAQCDKFGQGAVVLIDSAMTLGLDPRRGTKYFAKEDYLNKLRQYCAEGYRADLFCPTLQRLESEWRNVPYAVFPPGAPQM